MGKWLKFKRRYIYPFRWFYQSHIWGLRFRLSNVRRFASVVWHWDTCDWSPTVRMMEIAFKGISDLHRTNGIVMDSEKIARQTLIVSELCRRLQSDDYAEIAGWHRIDEMNPVQQKNWARHSEYLANQDVAYLAKTLLHLRKWWQ